MAILIKGADILTQDESRRILRGDILIEGDRIASVGPAADGNPAARAADEIIDAAGMIAMPGLINMHTHVGMTILRGYGEGLPLHRWLEEKIWPIEARQTAEDAAAGARLAFCEMLRSGTTSFAEMCLHDTYGVFTAAREAGMRGIIARCLLDFNHPEWVPKVMKEIGASLEHGSGMLVPSVAAHAPYTCSEELLLKTRALAREKGLRYQMHVGETRKEVFDTLNSRGKYPYEYLDSIGLMDGGCIYAHGNWLTKKEIALAGKAGITVVSCPASGLKLATGGITQIAELDAAGANVTLGTDSAASNNSLDMFQSMKLAALLQKHHYWKADAISAQRILDMATINGARALGVEAGAIAPGKLADIILLERGPNMAPGHDAVSDIVYSAGPQNVHDVIIGGRPVMRGRRICTMDEAAVIAAATRAANALSSP